MRLYVHLHQAYYDVLKQEMVMALDVLKTSVIFAHSVALWKGGGRGIDVDPYFEDAGPPPSEEQMAAGMTPKVAYIQERVQSYI